jgi:hypothetical protein
MYDDTTIAALKKLQARLGILTDGQFGSDLYWALMR